MVGITYGIEPYGGHAMGWTSPRVIASLVSGRHPPRGLLHVEVRVREPMFTLSLFKIRAFTAGIFASFLAAISRGGLMFILIIWLQGIWLPLHGYSFTATPLWAGISLIPLTVGMLIAGPLSGVLSDRYGPRPFATGGMIGSAICFALLEALPINFNYTVFAVILFFTGFTMASFGAPNRSGVMNALPPEHRGAGSGMNTTFQNSAQVISIGIFFSLMIVGLSSAAAPQRVGRPAGPRSSPANSGQGVAAAADLDAVRRLLGLQPGPASGRGPGIAHLSTTQQAALAQRGFFPSLIAGPFSKGLAAAFDFAIAMSLLAAVASWTRGKRYVHTPAVEEPTTELVLTPDRLRARERRPGPGRGEPAAHRLAGQADPAGRVHAPRGWPPRARRNRTRDERLLSPSGGPWRHARPRSQEAAAP